MKGKIGMRALSVLLALLLVSVMVVPVMAVKENSIKLQPIEVEDRVETHKVIELIEIDLAIQKATPYWILLTFDKKGKKYTLEAIDASTFSEEEKMVMKEFMEKTWEKYPVNFVKKGKNLTVITFNLENPNVKLTDAENTMLEKVAIVRGKYTNALLADEITTKWAGAQHQDIIKIACTKWGVSSTEAGYAANAADDPDSWPPIYPPTGWEWLDQFIVGICHSWDHYYNPDLGTGAAPEQCNNYATNAKSYYDNGWYYSAYTTLGYSSHFLTDVGNPMHTGRELNQAYDKYIAGTDTHALYESYVWNNWEAGQGLGYNFKSVIENNWYYYAVSDSTAATKSLASYSHGYLDTLYWKVANDPVFFKYDTTVRSITETVLTDTAKYSLGLVKYVRD